jgi:hypothetical protein
VPLTGMQTHIVVGLGSLMILANVEPHVA